MTALLAQVNATLATIADPEMPVVSIVDLGMVHAVSATSDEVTVTILPTFIGCPALDLIRADITAALSDLGPPVRILTTFQVAWTSDRISAAGLRALAAAGIAAPADPGTTRCPFCASEQVVMDSAFGPTQCRSLFYCRACRQPFEAMRQV